MYKVLFVCTGNICRSPSAEAVFRDRIEKAGLADKVECDSAGTHGYHIGEAPDPRSIEAGLRRGVDMANLKARKVSPKDYADFDLILALDSGHYDMLTYAKPEGAKAEVALMLPYAGVVASKDVPDPYYQKADAFEHVLDLLEDASDRLVTLVRKRLAA